MFEDEAEMNNVVYAIGDKSEEEMVRKGYVKYIGVIDSGAVDHVAFPGSFPNVAIKPSERSENGKHFASTIGQVIENMGEKRIGLTTNEGHRRNVVFQIAKVKRILLSARRMAKAGNRTILDEKNPYVENTATKERIQLRMEGSLYVMDFWVKSDTTKREGFIRQGR